MVKVVARQPVSEAAFEQLKTLLDPDEAVFSDGRANRFSVDADALHADVKGSGFTYVPFTGIPQAGTISQIRIEIAGDLAYVVKDAGIDIGDRGDGAPKGGSAIAALFSGKDTFQGSDGDDVFAGGGKSDRLFGKGGDDELHGDAGKDRLDGGTGANRLDGGGGKDSYVFTDPPGGGVDTIVRFERGETFVVDGSAFAGLARGKLADGQFVEATEARDANDRFIYDSTTGAIYHDPDGAGGTAQTEVARILADAGNFAAGDIFVA